MALGTASAEPIMSSWRLGEAAEGVYPEWDDTYRIGKDGSPFG